MNLFIMLFRAAILYFLVIVALRMMGKRQLGELQPSELVVTILISNIASIPIEDLSLPMVAGILPITVLVFLELVIANVSLRFPKFRRAVTGNPVMVIREGKIDQKTLHLLRFSVDDLMEGLRGQGYFDVRQVYSAVVETTGNLSVLPKFENQPVQASMLNIKGSDENPPAILICDGEVSESKNFAKPWNLQRLEKILKADGVSASDVFLFLADDNGSYTLIRKERLK
jgi:uncharacterized membrane protein YcaP (DUF421 family)